MENFSHSLSKKSYSSNGFAASKTVYDDVFGGAAKFGVPTLSPRVEDYAEIFGGFHSSRPSSIPILDLPVVDQADLSFDVRSASFDYSEVFGGFNGLDFAASYEELFNQSNSKGCDDSSDDAWTPAQSESLSDESEPSSCSENIQTFSDGDVHQSYDDSSKQFHISYHKANQKRMEGMPNATIHVAQLNAVPGYTFIGNQYSLSQEIEEENGTLYATHDLNLAMDYGEKIVEGKQFRKTTSLPPNSCSGVQTNANNLNPLVGYGIKSPSQTKDFITVSNINLRTRPSHLPPPARPPPALGVKKWHSGELNLKLKASKSFAFERVAGDGSPPFFDVEVDSSSAAAMKYAGEKAQAKLRNVKELMEIKKEDVQNHSKLHPENNVRQRNDKASEILDGSKSFNNETAQVTLESECYGVRPSTGEDRSNVSKSIQVDSDSVEGVSPRHMTENSSRRKHEKEYKSSHGYHKTEGTVAWREAEEFYEVVQTDKLQKASMKSTKPRKCGQVEEPAIEITEQKMDHREVKASRMTYLENRNQSKMTEGADGWNGSKRRSVATEESCGQEEYQEKTKVAVKATEWKDNEEKSRLSLLYGESKEIKSKADKCEKHKNMIGDQMSGKQPQAKFKLRESSGRIDIEDGLKDANEGKEKERRPKGVFEKEGYDKRVKKSVERAENEKSPKETLGQEVHEKQQTDSHNTQENEKNQSMVQKIYENAKLTEALKKEVNVKRSNEALKEEENEKMLKTDLRLEENGKKKLACEGEENLKSLREVHEQDEMEKRLNVGFGLEENAKKHKPEIKKEEIDGRLNAVFEREEVEKRLEEAWKLAEDSSTLPEVYDEDTCKEAFKDKGMEKNSENTCHRDETDNTVKAAGDCKSMKGCNNHHKLTKSNINEMKVDLDLKIHVHENGEDCKAVDGLYKPDYNENPQVTGVAVEHSTYKGKVEVTAEAVSGDEDNRLNNESEVSEKLVEAVDWATLSIEEELGSSCIHEDSFVLEEKEVKIESDTLRKSVEAGLGIRETTFKSDKKASQIGCDQKNADALVNRLGERGNSIKGVQFTFDNEGYKDKFTSFEVVREWIENERKSGDALPGVLELKGNMLNTADKLTNQSMERKVNNLNETVTPEEREKEERLRREEELAKDRLRKMEEEREREREREKDRMAVDRGTLDVRERAFAEARERAERAAVERATAEARQRAIADARERLEKSTAEARERSLAERASIEARLRAERAAVERATAEARERAAEKAASGARDRVERSISEKFFASSRSSGMRQSSSSSDLQDMQSQSLGTSSVLRYSYSSVLGGVEGESAQRCKARLERHQRTAERAAKALAEKNMRDLLAQREQAERNRVAETLDAEVKRWSTGKEGNLRALLSTLQYILGPDSGWQPIPLTEVITSVAVKKAYRKATLCVHPDKLQQRSASIQQKYICEKVFDLLKEAWNKFNSEER